MTNNIKKTPSHRINKKTRDKLKEINTSAFVDVMARQFGYDPHTILMDNVIPLNNGERLVSRAVTIRYLPSRKDFDELNKIQIDMDSSEIKKRIRATLFKDFRPKLSFKNFNFELNED